MSVTIDGDVSLLMSDLVHYGLSLFRFRMLSAFLAIFPDKISKAQCEMLGVNYRFDLHIITDIGKV